ncbi:GNAT family N-acetyltransferase [Chloroflexota bacterium]
MKIVTDRLIIRSIQSTDPASLAEIWIDPDVTYYMGGPRNYEEVLKSFIEDAKVISPPKIDLWPVIEKATGKIIGQCGIIDKDIEGKIEFELIYVLVKSVWGKGYATEAATFIKDYAFSQLGLPRIMALIDPKNTNSERVAIKVGLQYEKDAVRPSGNTMKVFALNAESHLY